MRAIERDNLVRLVQPRLTVLITSSSQSGNAVMAAAWITPVSHNPPIMGVSISSNRFTYKIIKECGYFAINIMDFSYVDSVAKAGKISGFEFDDKFRECRLTPVSAKKIPIKVIKEAVAVLECKVLKTVSFGDHEFIAGEVVYGYAGKDFRDHWNMVDYNPILYVSDGHFYTLDKKSLKKYEL